MNSPHLQQKQSKMKATLTILIIFLIGVNTGNLAVPKNSKTRPPLKSTSAVPETTTGTIITTQPGTTTTNNYVLGELITENILKFVNILYIFRHC